jgi:hypothetical protein
MRAIGLLGEHIPLGVAVKVAQVPDTYQVPPLMIHPFRDPPLDTLSIPLPENDPLPPPPPVGLVGLVGGVEVVAVVEPDFGKYLTRVAGQVDLVPSGLAATNLPVCTEPRTS